MLDGMSVDINGVKSDIIDLTGEKYRALFADMLILEPIFDPGENKVMVEGYLNGERIATAEALVFYQDRFDGVPPEKFKPEVFHSPEREKPCEECHNMNPAAADLSASDPRVNPCGSCHTRMLDKAHVHGPAGVFECNYCHDVESVPTKYNARDGDAELCVECHEDKMDEYRKSKFVHGPIEAGLCMVCHDPHASDQPAQLIVAVNGLCLSCHESKAKETHVVQTRKGGHPLSGPVNPARPERDFNCASCHNPHAGELSWMPNFGVTSRMALCVNCHKK